LISFVPVGRAESANDIERETRDGERSGEVSRPSIPPLPAEDPFIGKTVDGRYLVQAAIARGGMGTVYRAEQLQLGRQVAIKILHTSSAGGTSEGFHQRFYREARACAELRSSHTVVIHDYGRTEDGTYFLAMELLEGQTLHEFSNEHGPLDGPTAVHIASQVAESLTEAHDHDLVHRDLKPSNIFIADSPGGPTVKVLDFGLVKRLGQDDASLTRSGTLVGSPKYMSPEQVIGVHIDARSDVYSLGAVLYRMVAGRAPFEGDSDFELMAAHVHSPPQALSDVYPSCDVSDELELVILRCLAKDKSERFETMEAVLTALQNCTEHAGGARLARTVPPPSPSPTTKPTTTPKSETLAIPEDQPRAATESQESRETITPPKRRPAPATSRRSRTFVAAALAVLLLGVAAWALSDGGAEDDAAATADESEPTRQSESAEPNEASEPSTEPIDPVEFPPASALEPPPTVTAAPSDDGIEPEPPPPAAMARMDRPRRARATDEPPDLGPVEPVVPTREVSPMRSAMTDNRDPWAE